MRLYMQSQYVAQPDLTPLTLYLERVRAGGNSLSMGFCSSGMFLDLLRRRVRIRRDVVDIRLLNGGEEIGWHHLRQTINRHDARVDPTHLVAKLRRMKCIQLHIPVRP